MEIRPGFLSSGENEASRHSISAFARLSEAGCSADGFQVDSDEALKTISEQFSDHCQALMQRIHGPASDLAGMLVNIKARRNAFRDRESQLQRELENDQQLAAAIPELPADVVAAKAHLDQLLSLQARAVSRRTELEGTLREIDSDLKSITDGMNLAVIARELAHRVESQGIRAILFARPFLAALKFIVFALEFLMAWVIALTLDPWLQGIMDLWIAVLVLFAGQALILDRWTDGLKGRLNWRLFGWLLRKLQMLESKVDDLERIARALRDRSE